MRQAKQIPVLVLLSILFITSRFLFAKEAPEVAALKAQAAAATAKAELAKAELSKIQAGQELQMADALGQAATQKALAEAQTALLNQLTAQAQAQAAASAAEAAAAKAKFGTVTGNSETTGAVTVDTNAGAGEASLLSAQAVTSLAEKIVAALPTGPQTRATYIIFAGNQRPTFSRSCAFDLRSELVTRAFAVADTAIAEATAARTSALTPPIPPTKQPKGGPPRTALPAIAGLGAAVTGAGAALDVAAKLGSYFMTDYKIGPVPVTGSDDDLLALSVAGRLPGSLYPARFLPDRCAKQVGTLLKPLFDLRAVSFPKLRDAQAWGKELADRAQQPAFAGSKSALLAAVAAYGKASDLLIQSLKLLEEFLTDLSAASSGGVPAFCSILEEKLLSEALAKDYNALFVRLNMSAGGYYTKKNLWTFFGRMPFFVMGGAVASYFAVDGTTGTVLAAGEFAVHSGYFKLSDVPKQFP